MTRTLLASAIVFALSALSPASFAADSLTIYSGDFDSVAQGEGQPGGPGLALVEQDLAFDLAKGTQQQRLPGLPRALDASSVVLKLPPGVRLLGQRFDFALGAQGELLRRALGQQVTVEQSVGGQRQTHTGTLLFAGDGELSLRLPDGRIRVISNYSSYDLVDAPGALSNLPTLAWTLSSGGAGRQPFQLNYSTAGLAWRAEYNIDARGQGSDCRLAFDGAAMVVNRSGSDFDDVNLTLVAGEPNRARGGIEVMATMAKAERGMIASDASAPQAQPSGEYQAYRMPNPGDVPQGSVQAIPLVDRAEDVACERRYETSTQMGGWRPPYPILDENFSAGDAQPQPVIATLRFRNAKDRGLGLPLPAGRVRMFEGRDFLGEATIGHTPAGANVSLAIGNVFDLGAERSREDFKLDREARTITERVSVLLRNAKAVPATVRVGERLGRWTDWEIESSTVPAVKRDAQNVSFDVAVPANGETRLVYTVRYRWAADVKIP